jgi:hypothetical protein
MSASSPKEASVGATQVNAKRTISASEGAPAQVDQVGTAGPLQAFMGLESHEQIGMLKSAHVRSAHVGHDAKARMTQTGIFNSRSRKG